ncbi:MAG: biotin/lipoyl-containing protein, partial [Oscillospiraceae bacterium]
MVKQIKMPSAGQTTDAAVITKWLVSPGDTVKRGDILLEAETDKAVLPVESFAAGIVLECSVQEGDTVDAGDQLALVGDEKDWSSHDTAAKPVSPVPVQTTSAPQEPADDFIPILAQDRSAELSQAA